MLQLPETRTVEPRMAENSAVIAQQSAEIFPTDVRSLIVLHRAADAAVNAAQSDAEMLPHNIRSNKLYRALMLATPDTLQEEAERLSYIYGYLRDYHGTTTGSIDGGWFDLPEIKQVAKNLTKLAKPVGSGALKVVSKEHQPLKLCPEPSLKAALDRLQAENDITGMVVLFDYFIALGDASNLIINQPRAATAEPFIEHDSCRHFGRAYAVADRLKQLKPTNGFHRKERAQALVAAAFLMDASVKQAADLMQYLSEERE